MMKFLYKMAGLKFSVLRTLFKDSDLWRRMEETNEGSPYHREPSVSIHTDMVISEYFAQCHWYSFRKYLNGALACLFHDVGKPGAMEVVIKEGRGAYKRFGGHEILSARLWEDYAVTHWNKFSKLMNLTPSDIYDVGLMIEHHLPWALKDRRKLDNLALTIKQSVGFEMFKRVLLADQRGRISDDQETKLKAVGEWLANFEERVDAVELLDYPEGAPMAYVPIGASGSGKTTMLSRLREMKGLIDHFSLDMLRMRWYSADQDGPEAYQKAWRIARDDKTFDKRTMAEFMSILQSRRDVYIDNMNLSRKARRRYVEEARRKGYTVVAILFPASLQTLIDRQETRGDKRLNALTVHKQYFALQLPQLGEFDLVTISESNLPSHH